MPAGSTIRGHSCRARLFLRRTLILESGCSTVADAGGKRRREFQATDESPGTYAKPA